MVTNRSLELTGIITWDDHKKLWNATITFSYTEASYPDDDVDKGNRALEGTFVFTKTGAKGQYWVMATGLKITKGEKFLIPAEAVSGEVHRIGDLP